MTELSCSAME